jgi:hypothetical protein
MVLNSTQIGRLVKGLQKATAASNTTARSCCNNRFVCAKAR